VRIGSDRNTWLIRRFSADNSLVQTALHDDHPARELDPARTDIDARVPLHHRVIDPRVHSYDACTQAYPLLTTRYSVRIHVHILTNNPKCGDPAQDGAMLALELSLEGRTIGDREAGRLIYLVHIKA
jgi:hypothetical protein